MHIFINPAALATCQKCGKAVRPHTICKHCGYYKGKEFIDVMASLTKKEKKAKEKEMKEMKKEHKHDEKTMSMEQLSKK